MFNTMHLEIIQPKSARETVSLGVINKLYELAYENASLGITSQLDNTSNIVGSVSLYAADKKKVEYLAGTNGVGGNGRFQDFNIYCTTYYLNFLDDAFAQVCANVYGNGEGTTAADLVGITSVTQEGKNLFSAITGNTSVVTMDFRQFPKLDFGGSRKLWNLPNAQNVYIDSAEGFQISNFHTLGPTVDGKPHLNKLLVRELNYPQSANKNIRILAGTDTVSQCTFDTIGIRNMHLQAGTSTVGIGTYFTRNARAVTNLYLGHCFVGDTEVALNYYRNYGDDISRVTNIYVPVGMRQAYVNLQWTDGSTVRTNFIEYDFDTDPDGIFSVFNQ